MELVKFSNYETKLRIKASDLDANFARLKPMQSDGNAKQYLLTETPDGWSLKIFPEFPSGTGPFFLAMSNGQLYWSGSGVGEPDDTALQLVEVERCDGKKMMVLGTGWY